MRRRISERSNIGRTPIEDLSITECNAITYYAYKVSEHYNSVANVEELGDIFFSLIRKYKKLDRANEIAKLFINKLISEKKLTPLTSTKNYNHPFDCSEKLSKNYKEDIRIADDFSSWTSSNESIVNMIRVFWNGDDKTEFYKFFAMVLFSNKNFTEIPNRISIPAKFKNAAENTSQIEFLTNALSLSEFEQKILMFRYRTTINSEFNYYIKNQDLNLFKVTADCIDVTTNVVRRYLRSNSKLVEFGFFDSTGDINSEIFETIQQKNINTYFLDLIKEYDVSSSYELDSFSVDKKKTQIASNFLKKDNFNVASQGVNILLYGKPGSGKTEFAKSLIKKCGKKCFIFKNETEVSSKDEEDHINVLSRLNCFLSLQSNDSIIIVDEAESVLKTCGISFFGGNISTPEKGTVNRMLENTKNKVIWILNYTNSCDESTLRRFTYSIHFDEMPSTTLQKIANKKLSKLNLTDSLHEKLLDLCGKYRISGASVENMLKTIECSSNIKKEKLVIDEVKSVLESNSTLIYGKTKMRDKVSSSYDLSVLNSTISAQKIVKMIENAQAFAEENGIEKQNGIKILFYGMSGTGKTEFARFIAEKLGKRIVLKRASDIFGKYVGENEQNIKEAFEEAESSGSILLFDEADSFFADRNSAKNSWERTMVNEFLTQMEEFSGILICTTNLRNIMDSAMQRRFHILSEFMPLEKDGIKKLLEKYFGSFTFSEELVSSLTRYNSVTPGDFGQLYGKVHFIDREELSPEYIIEELKAIQDEKDGISTRIGFCA